MSKIQTIAIHSVIERPKKPMHHKINLNMHLNVCTPSQPRKLILHTHKSQKNKGKHACTHARAREHTHTHLCLNYTVSRKSIETKKNATGKNATKNATEKHAKKTNTVHLTC